MDYNEMSLEDLDAELERLDAERLAAKERGREIMSARHRKIAEDNAAVYGLSPEEYADVKRQAAEEGTPLQAALTRARGEAVRQLQVARAEAARVGAKAKGV